VFAYEFFLTKFATQLVFSLASLPSSTGPQAAAQTDKPCRYAHYVSLRLWLTRISVVNQFAVG